MISDLTFIGYSIPALAYLLLSVALLSIWRARFEGMSLFLATLATSLWCSVLAYSAFHGSVPHVLSFVTEVVADIAWLLFISSVFGGAVMARKSWLGRYLGIAMASVVLVWGVTAEITTAGLFVDSGTILILGSILTSLYCIIALEQVFRNARASQRRNIRYLCLGIGTLFVADLILYSSAIFAGRIGPLLWGIRGYLLAMAAPLIAISIYRRPREAPGIFVSREVVFYTSMIVVTGLYLTVVGISGQLVREFDRQWGEAAQVVLFFGSAVFFLILILSDEYRGKARVFLAKHFFERKYDYREEWLRLINTLTVTESKLPLTKRAVQAFAQIVGSPSGVLWLQQENSAELYPAAGWNIARPDTVIEADQALIGFVRRTRWVVDLNGLRCQEVGYGELGTADIPAAFANTWVLIPLIHEEKLRGLVALSAPDTLIELNFEDYDLLKTAGQQVASYLGQEMAIARLAEVKQFEAFSKLTAFLMHDLKNAMAQQLLIVENAEKHRRNPDFVDDAIEVIKGSAQRIRKVVNQLQQGTPTEQSNNVDIGKLLLIAISSGDEYLPVPALVQSNERFFVLGDEERLLMAIRHTIRNAQDATPDNGSIGITLSLDGKFCNIQIKDSGAGMDRAFIRDRLFKPFDSTKGAQGMGIGAHQVRETVRSMGGDVMVKSTLGEGTTMTLRIPLSQSLLEPE